MEMKEMIWDVLVVGSGPTGIAVGAESRRAGLSAVLVDAGPLTANLLGFPTYMRFFTTRDRMEIAGVPFSIPEDKANRRQALAYYQAVVGHHQLPVQTYQRVVGAEWRDDHFEVRALGDAGSGETVHRAKRVVVATGYFGHPRRLGVPGEEQDWVRVRYREPYEHCGERVAIVGAGNSACEVALDLWRAGVDVTLIHRRASVKPTVKYWVRPDIENRIAEGSIRALFETTVRSFHEGTITLERGGARESIEVDAVYTLIGYTTDAALLRACGVRVDADELIPEFDDVTGETNIPGLYVAGAVRSGVHTNRIFIDNSRDHASAIVADIAATLTG